jgi:hypothetical protein
MMGNQNNFNRSASTMGGGGFQSNQEFRGPNGLYGSGGLLGSGAGNGRMDEDQLRRMLKKMGIDISALNGGGQQQPQPSPQPANWAFPQYTQSWLPPPPNVPPMVPTPPFKRS